MGDALYAEWTKMRTLASTYWILVGTVLLTIALSAAVTAASRFEPWQAQDTVKLSLTGTYLGQAVVAIFGVLAMSNEYANGMVSVTLAAMPRRLVALSAKAVILVAAVAVVGTVAVGGSLVCGRALLPAQGFTAAHGYPLLSLAHGPTLRAALGSVVYLVFIALLGLGTATVVRDTATAIGVVLGLLYLFPLLANVVGNPVWRRHLEQAGPMSAGLAVQATTNLKSLPIGPWAGIGVLGAWAGAALLAGGARLKYRDA